MSKAKKLWGGRFDVPTDSLMERYSQSIRFDHRLYEQDIAGSIAHARMLAKQQIISQADFDQIRDGLEEIRREIESGQFNWREDLEDVHLNIESALTARIGEAGKKLHTGRSRNDQIATDMRLYLRQELDRICDQLTRLQYTLVELASAEAETIMPGYTHMQSAQPVTFGHHVLAWNEMFERDFERLRECRRRVNICPLGSAALAGTGFPIDREMTARELKFDEVASNSLDAVSDRDFIVEFLGHAALLMVHLSRISEELVLWSSDAFGFVDPGDAFCTGSSIMPQKKNPDVAELARGKSARAIGNLMALMTLMKGQPLAYNRDNQEDKEPLFDTVDTLLLCLQVFSAMIPQITIHRDAMLLAASRGYTTATDLADYLVSRNIPFRDAHEIVGRIVSHAIACEQPLSALKLDQLRAFCDVIEADVYQILTVEGSVHARDHFGATAPARVREQVVKARQSLDARETASGVE